jgi:hypothetical protein
VLIHLWPIVL